LRTGSVFSAATLLTEENANKSVHAKLSITLDKWDVSALSTSNTQIGLHSFARKVDFLSNCHLNIPAIRVYYVREAFKVRTTTWRTSSVPY